MGDANAVANKSDGVITWDARREYSNLCPLSNPSGYLHCLVLTLFSLVSLKSLTYW